MGRGHPTRMSVPPRPKQSVKCVASGVSGRMTSSMEPQDSGVGSGEGNLGCKREWNQPGNGGGVDSLFSQLSLFLCWETWMLGFGTERNLSQNYDLQASSSVLPTA